MPGRPATAGPPASAIGPVTVAASSIGGELEPEDGTWSSISVRIGQGWGSTCCPSLPLRKRPNHRFLQKACYSAGCNACNDEYLLMDGLTRVRLIQRPSGSARR